MITGFNTDIEYKGVTYHVQTEDKGVATPMILSLVYDRGTILASKRSPYDDLLVPDFDEQALSDRLQKQHKLICAAVRAGRIEDLKRMTMKESSSRQKGLVAQKEIKTVSETIETPAQKNGETFGKSKSKAKNEEIPLPELLREKRPPDIKAKEAETDLPSKITQEKTPPEIPKPDGEPIWSVPVKVVEETTLTEGIQIIEEETILPDEAVEIITDFAKNEQTAPGKLKIELPAGITFKGGERKTVGILVRRGNAGKGLSGAHIMIKVLGAAFRPLIFHAKTDNYGVATVHLQMPSFRSGRAAIIIKAMSEGEEVELRRVIRQG
ncbi:MAG: hypothetical protein M3033_10205 [Acidobacteriota bacterium]|nr:hypothetical protein [Acidobacteriota bacterium]